MPLVHIDAEDVLGDLSDDDLLREIKNRKLRVPMDLFVPAPTERKHRDAIFDVIADLETRPVNIAVSTLSKLIRSIVPAELFDALEAAQDGRKNDAICILDRYAVPAPSATATKLPAPSRTEGE